MPPIRRTAAIALAMFSILALVGPVTAKSGGTNNSVGSAKCANGGYLNWGRVDGPAFRNEGDCTKYAAKDTLPLVALARVVYHSAGAGSFTAEFHAGVDSLSTLADLEINGTSTQVLVDDYRASQYEFLYVTSPQLCGSWTTVRLSIADGNFNWVTSTQLPPPDASICP